MSLIRKHGAVLQAWACLDLVILKKRCQMQSMNMQKSNEKILLEDLRMP